MDRFAKVHMMWTQVAAVKQQQGHLADACMELMVLLLPIWLSVLVGLLLGWSWRPRWVSLVVVALRTRPRLAWSFPPGFGARRLWLAATAAAAAPAVRDVCGRMWTWMQKQAWLQQLLRQWEHRERDGERQQEVGANEQVAVAEPLQLLCRAGAAFEGMGGAEAEGEGEGEGPLVGSADLEALCRRLEGMDGGPPWGLLMEKAVPGMRYTAWRRDPEVGPTEYRSRTLIEACSPELMRDFFWDDEFRLSSRWDEMLVQQSVVEECPRTGTQIVQWVRKFPVFCKDREYVIGRRIWSLNNTYYCVTKGVSHSEVPPKDKPRRVSVFYSSWRIRAVENGACEVMLFHHEDMGIQRDVAKLAIRQGMWPAVRKIEPGVRQYQTQRTQRPSQLSRSASMASVHTPISPCGPALSRVWHSLSDLQRLDPEDAAASGGEAQGHGAAGRGEEGSGDRLAGQGRCWEDRNGEAAGSQLDAGGEERHRQGMVRCPQGRRVRVRWWVTASVVAMACGVSPSLVWKVLLAGAARNMVASRLRRK